MFDVCGRNRRQGRCRIWVEFVATTESGWTIDEDSELILFQALFAQRVGFSGFEPVSAPCSKSEVGSRDPCIL